MDCSPPASSIHGILQTSILECVATSFSRGSSWPSDQTQVSSIAGEFFTIWANREAQFSSVQFSCSVVDSFPTLWTAARQASLSITNSWSLLKLTSIKLMMPFNHLTLCRLLLLLPSIFPISGHFQMSQFFASGGQCNGTSASASVLPINIQDWFPLGWTGLNSLQCKGLSRVFSKLLFKSSNSSVLSFLYGPTLTSIHDYWISNVFFFFIFKDCPKVYNTHL